MNAVKLKDFNPETLLLVNSLIEKRTIVLRKIGLLNRTDKEDKELFNLLEFQTQTLYTLQLLSREQKIFSN